MHLATWPGKRRNLVDAVPACGDESERPMFAWQARYVSCEACKAILAARPEGWGGSAFPLPGHPNYRART